MIKKALSLLIFLLLSIPIFATSLNIKYAVPLQLNDGIEQCVGEALNLVLSSHIIVDEDESDIIYLTVDALEYIEDEKTLRLNFDTSYKNKNLNFNINILKAKNDDDIYKILKDKIIYAYKYDISSLFEKNDELVIDYYTPYLASFTFNAEDPPDEAQYYYVRNKADDIVAVANINTLFDKNATLNIISNDLLTPNLRLTDGPKGLLSTSVSFDIIDKSIFGSLSYTYYKGFIPFLVDANLIVEGGGAFSLEDSISGGFLDIGLSLELPLSLLFDSDSFLKNTNLRATVLGGVAFKDKLYFNSKYTIGYGIYFSNKYNLEVYYEKNTMFTLLSDSTFILGMRFSVLL
jgi:hypothetical protein